MTAIQSLTRGALRRSIGRNLGIIIDGVATAADAGKTLLTDTKNLLGGADEHNQKEVLIYDATGSIVDGESSIVSDFASNVATCVPIFSAAIAVGDKFEMWKTPWRIDDINDAINQAINEVSNKALKIKEDSSLFTESSKYLYTIPTGFTHLYKVEYVSSQTEVAVEDCEEAWTAGTSVTATADSSVEKKGTYCAKLVVAAGAAAGAILAYEDISAIDLTGCDKIEFWMYSSIALTAGQLQIHLSSTAAIASAEETIDIPAMTAATWYRHSLSMEAPHSDSAIISVGIYQVSDVGACTLYIDDVIAVNFASKEYEELPIEHWNIARGSTNYLQITGDGLSLIGSDTFMRLTGYQIPARLDADATASEVDPAYLIAQTTGRLLISHAKSSYLDIHDRANLSKYWLGQAASMLPALSPSMPGTTRSI